MDAKQWYTSKRLWTGVIAIITGLSLIFTGEKTLQEVIPELVMTGFGLVQLIVGLISGRPVAFGGKVLFRG